MKSLGKILKTMFSFFERDQFVPPGEIKLPKLPVFPVLPNRFYYVGLSTMPPKVFVTKVTPSQVVYRMYPYFTSQDVYEDKSVFYYLCKKGTITKLKQLKDTIHARQDYPLVVEELRDEATILQALLDGVNAMQEQKLSDFKRLKIIVRVKQEQQNSKKNFAADADKYGTVITDEECPYWFMIFCTLGDVHKIEQEGLFEIIKMEDDF